MNRRDFITTSTIGGLALAVGSSLKAAESKLTIQQAIDLITKKLVGKPFPQTVDTVKTGDTSQPLKGIVTTFLATNDIINECIKTGANLLITHEPTFYNHLDETGWLKNDDIYKAKKELLEKHNIVVWRCHDYTHSHKPDIIIKGIVQSINWEKYQDKENPTLFHIPEMPLKELAQELKKAFNLPHITYLGDDNLACKNVGIKVGASGGTSHVKFTQNNDIDVLAVGEINEWETNIYCEDAGIGLILIGHAPSEAAGMKYFAEWIAEFLPKTDITFIPSKNSFKTI